MRAIHLILDFKPLSDTFQEVGHAIRVGDLWLAWIDISMPEFLAREDLPSIELPLHCALPEVATLREEIASSRLSLKAEIDQIHLEEEGEVQEEPVEILDSKGKLDKASVARSPKLVVARVDPSSEEDEKMDLNPRKGLKDLLAGRNKGSLSEKTFKSLVLANLPPLHPLPTTTFGLLPIPD